MVTSLIAATEIATTTIRAVSKATYEFYTADMVRDTRKLLALLDRKTEMKLGPSLFKKYKLRLLLMSTLHVKNSGVVQTKVLKLESKQVLKIQRVNFQGERRIQIVEMTKLAAGTVLSKSINVLL